MNVEIACKRDEAANETTVTLQGPGASILTNWDILTHAISDSLHVPLEAMVATVTGERSRQLHEEYKRNQEVYRMEVPMKGGDDNG